MATFHEWYSGIKGQLAKFREPIVIPINTNVESVSSGNILDNIERFGIQFMETMFVSEFVIPAFQEMGLPNTPAPYMPQIEIGQGYRGQETYRKGVGHLGENSLDRAYAKLKHLEESLETATQSLHRAEKYKSKKKDVPKLQARVDALRKKHSQIANRVIKLQENDLKRQEQRQIAKQTKSTSPELQADWKRGFSLMLSKMTTPITAKREGTAVVVTMGSMKDLMNMKLSSYSVTQGTGGHSEFDSFFMAAEFGTGIYPDPIRTSGRTKESLNGQSGYWWFGDKGASDQWYGGLFAGQRGMHFMFQRGSTTPNPRIKEYIGNNLQASLRSFLKR